MLWPSRASEKNYDELSFRKISHHEISRTTMPCFFLKDMLCSRSFLQSTLTRPCVGHPGDFLAKVKFAEADVRGAKKASGAADPKIYFSQTGRWRSKNDPT